MRVSRNELIAALSRAYEGAGHHVGDYEDAAQAITWSQMCGLGGFDRIALPPPAPKGDATPRLIFENDDIAVIDAGGAETCEHGALAVQLAAAKAAKTGFAIVELARCRHPDLILRDLALVAESGVYLSVYWTDQAGSHGASFDAGAAFPHYWRRDAADPGRETATVTMICTPQAGLLADAVTHPAARPDLQRVEVTPAEFAAAYARSLDRGLDIPAERWDALNAAAWPILVPTDPQSRAGAGPG